MGKQFEDLKIADGILVSDREGAKLFGAHRTTFWRRVSAPTKQFSGRSKRAPEGIVRRRRRVMRSPQAIDRTEKNLEFRTVVRPYCILQTGDPEKRGTIFISQSDGGVWDVLSLTASQGSGYTIGGLGSPCEAVMAALDGAREFRVLEIILLLPWTIINGGRNENND